MNIDNIKIECHGFDPNYEVWSLISGMTYSMHRRAPSDSFIKVSLNKANDLIQASCKIASRTRQFASEATSKCPIESMEKVRDSIMHQIEDWQSRRFHRNDNKFAS